MPKKSTLLSVSIFFLLFIGLSDYGYGCHKGKPHGKKAGPCDDPEPPEPPGGAGLTANLTGGTFVFDSGPLPVTLNSKKTTLRSDQDVNMTRPPDDDPSQFEWDEVFVECADFLGGTPDDLHFGDDDWEIYVDTGHIHVQMFGHKAGLDHNPTTRIVLHLENFLGLDSYPNVTFPPLDDGMAQFCLDQEYWVNFSLNGVRGRGGRCPAMHYAPVMYPSTLTICAAGVECNDPPDACIP